ncbi:hypothetical protein D3C76_1510770 [compost metagenome]
MIIRKVRLVMKTKVRNSGTLFTSIPTPYSKISPAISDWARLISTNVSVRLKKLPNRLAPGTLVVRVGTTTVNTSPPTNSAIDRK